MEEELDTHSLARKMKNGMPLSATPSAKLASMEMVQSAGKTVLMA
jgi:hypothetical protein